MKNLLKSSAFLLMLAPTAYAQTSDIQQLKSIIGLQQNQIRQLQQQLNPPCDGKLSDDKRFCFKYFTQPLSATHADLSCIAWSGRLASVRNNADMQTIASLLPPHTGAWIGAVRTASGFAWSDGAAMDYTSWRGGEPNNAGGVENCAVTGFHAPNHWGDFDCSIQTGYICKRSMIK